jgi:hypothetical protein
MNKKMNHLDYMAKLRYKSIDELTYIIGDASAAIAAYPDSPNAGYYQDEVHYAYMELRRRTTPVTRKTAAK